MLLDAVVAFFQMVRAGVFLGRPLLTNGSATVYARSGTIMMLLNSCLYVARPSSDVASAIPPHLVATVVAHTATWRLLPGDSTLLVLLRGALPGDPIC